MEVIFTAPEVATADCAAICSQAASFTPKVTTAPCGGGSPGALGLTTSKVPGPAGAVAVNVCRLKSARNRTSAFPFFGSVFAVTRPQTPGTSVHTTAPTSAEMGPRDTRAGDEMASAGFIGCPRTTPLKLPPALPLPQPSAQSTTPMGTNRITALTYS